MGRLLSILASATYHQGMSQPKILGRTVRLATKHREVFDRIFHFGGGDVLDFSDRTLAEWFEENRGIQIFQSRFQIEGASKGKPLLLV